MKERTTQFLLAAVALLWVAIVCAALCVGKSSEASPPESAELVVHEWGTFTSLQDERGDALAGINIDDEPLPDFVQT
jgi:hypothetical protein